MDLAEMRNEASNYKWLWLTEDAVFKNAVSRLGVTVTPDMTMETAKLALVIARFETARNSFDSCLNSRSSARRSPRCKVSFSIAPSSWRSWSAL